MRDSVRFILYTLLCLLALLSLEACQREDVPFPEELLLTQDELIGDWHQSVEGPHTPTGQAPLGGGPGAMGASIVFFYHPAEDGTAGAHEEIMLFRHERDAREEFDRQLLIAFREGLDWVWINSGIENEVTPNATESSFRCTHGRTETMCRLVALYGRYLVDLKVDLDGLNSRLEPVRVISQEDLREIILYLDRKISSAILDGD